MHRTIQDNGINLSNGIDLPMPGQVALSTVAGSFFLADFV
jgi:hypothetical protein